MLLIKNKLAIRYINEIQKVEKKIRNEDLKKSEVILKAVERYYISLIKEIIENYKISKEELEKLVSDKELLKRIII